MSNTSSFPTSLDSYTNPSSSSAPNNPSLSAGQTLQNDSLANVETYLGVTGSTVSTSLTYQVNQLRYANSLPTDSGTANAYVLTPAVALTAYTLGQNFSFIPANTNTGASTINVSSLGTKAIQYGGQALTPGFLSSFLVATLVYDGTYFQLQNPATSILGYASIASEFDTTSVSTDVSVTGLSITCIVPAGKKVLLSLYTPYFTTSATTGSNFSVKIKEGSTNLARSLSQTLDYNPQSVSAVISPTAGSHTYFATIAQNASGTLAFGAYSDSPAYIMANLL